MMPRGARLRSLVLGAAGALGVFGCAGAPPPPAAAPPPTDAFLEGQLLCGKEVAYLSFERLGVPKEARPVEIVKIGPRIWILFEPARLLRIDRRGEAADVGVRLGGEGEDWSSIALDPVDGSLWLAARDRLALWHYEATGTLRRVPLQKVEGEGGFVDLAVGPSGVFAAPTAADRRVWRIGRDGQVLATDFPARRPSSALDPERGNPSEPLRPGDSSVRLEHDAAGAVLAWFPDERTLYRADAAGRWAAVDPSIFSAGGSDPVRGVDVGGENEHWYANGRSALFYWKGTPVFLGAHSMLERKGKVGTIYHFPGGRELFEACNGWFVLDVATDETGYAALTDHGVVIGDFSEAGSVATGSEAIGSKR